jgi:serine/threonine protein kinase
VNTLSKPLEDKFTIEKQLGAGAQGTAYLVKRKEEHLKDKSDPYFVAKESNDTTKQGLKTFMEEVDKMKHLQHPNCLQVLEIIKDEKPMKPKLYIITEFAAGGDLFHYMRQMLDSTQEVNEHTIAGLFRQAMGGVNFLHGKDMVHNDLKPDNLLVMDQFGSKPTPRVVVCDFGCATWGTDKKIFFGDPRYLAPEAMKNMLDHIGGKKIKTDFITQAIDTWAMGVTLYEMLANGTIPFIYSQCSLKDLAATFQSLSAAVQGQDDIEFKLMEDGSLKDKWLHSDESKDLLKAMLTKDPTKRERSEVVMKHPWFDKAKRDKLPKEVRVKSQIECCFDKIPNW